MEINITGRQIDIGDAFRQYVTDRISDISDKYFHKSTDASVTAGKEAHLFTVSCHVHAAHDLNIQSSAEADDVHVAFDLAADRLEKQLRRYKRRIKNHNTDSFKTQAPLSSAQSYIIAPDEETGEGVDEPVEDIPVIIAETKTEIRKLSVGDAVMRMDLAGLPAMMFKNSKTNRLNVVYRRNDGNIGWIDPAEE